MSQPEVICERRGRAGVAILDRPAALNALTLGMVRSLAAALDAWEADPAVHLVIIGAAGEKAFCAGGDIRVLYDQGRAGDHAAQRAFWREEYTLNIRIKRYPKPVVALIDGIVMGGGVGVSVHAHHRVAGDRYQFAMPEVGIGFFPDVGATWFLPRLPGSMGTYLALTGQRIGLSEGLTLGLADAHVASDRMAALADALQHDAPNSHDEPAGPAAIIERFASPPLAAAQAPEAQRGPAAAGDRVWIEDCFVPGTLGEIVARIEVLSGAGHAQASAALARMRRNAPMSMAIAARQMTLGRHLGFEAAMCTEYRIVSRLCEGHDFYEGVRAAIIDRDNRPAWHPSSIEEVDEAALDAYFTALGDDELPVTAASGR